MRKEPDRQFKLTRADAMFLKTAHVYSLETGNGRRVTSAYIQFLGALIFGEAGHKRARDIRQAGYFQMEDGLWLIMDVFIPRDWSYFPGPDPLLVPSKEQLHILAKNQALGVGDPSERHLNELEARTQERGVPGITAVQNHAVSQTDSVSEILSELQSANIRRLTGTEIRLRIREWIELGGTQSPTECSNRVASVFRSLRTSGHLIDSGDGTYLVSYPRTESPVPVTCDEPIAAISPIAPGPSPTPVPIQPEPSLVKSATEKTPEQRRGELVVLTNLRPPPTNVRLHPTAKPLRFLADMILLEDRFGGWLPHEISRWLAIDYMWITAPATNEGSEFRTLRNVGFMRSTRRYRQRRDDWYVTPEGRACQERLQTIGTLTIETADAYIRERGFATKSELPNLQQRLTQVEPRYKQALRAWQNADPHGLDYDAIFEARWSLEDQREALRRQIGGTRLNAH